MSPAKAQALIRELKVAERKVFDAVPALASSNCKEILNEIIRAHGSWSDRSSLDRCLLGLRDVGLIVEAGPGQWTRARGATTSPRANKEEPMPMQNPDMLTRIADLAKSLRVASKSLATAADELDTIALEVEERCSASSDNMEKFKQLQALLKSLTT